VSKPDENWLFREFGAGRCAFGNRGIRFEDEFGVLSPSLAKANFKACVRQSGFDEDIVTYEDISRGGLRFKSRRRYVEGSMIEIAVPYSLGSPSIFVSAQIVRVRELPGEKLFQCGVAYISK
jgi:hypothetical protein